MHFSGAVARLRGPIRNRTKPMLSHLPSGSFSRTVLQQQAINQQALSQFMLGVNGCTTRSHVRAGSVQNAQHGPCTVLHHGLRLHGGSVRTVASSSAYDNPALYSNEDTVRVQLNWMGPDGMSRGADKVDMCVAFASCEASMHETVIHNGVS